MTTDTPFKVGDKVRIVDTHSEKHGMEGEITTLAMNGAIIRFPNGDGTIVRFTHLEHI